MSITISPIAHIVSEFPQKFGIPRQPLLAPSLEAKIVFEPEFRNPDCIRGLEHSSHLWIIWEFSEFTGKPWKALVRPPRLGGNRKMGVFATRSPLRPNNLGLSAVKIKSIETDPKLGPIIHVLGADMLNGSPIYDIKPYVPYTDAIADATTEIFDRPRQLDDVILPSGTDEEIPNLEAIREILLQDPRPAYKDDGQQTYAFEYAGLHIEFRVENNVAIVSQIKKASR